MDNTPFSKKVDLIASLWFLYKDNADGIAKQLFEVVDVGAPLCFAVAAGYANLTPEGKRCITDTWETMCEIFDIDPTEYYSTVADILEAIQDDEG